MRPARENLGRTNVADRVSLREGLYLIRSGESGVDSKEAELEDFLLRSEKVARRLWCLSSAGVSKQYRALSDAFECICTQ